MSGWRNRTISLPNSRSIGLADALRVRTEVSLIKLKGQSRSERSHRRGSSSRKWIRAHQREMNGREAFSGENSALSP